MTSGKKALEVDRIFYIFGSFSRKKQEQRKSLQLQQSLSVGNSPLHRNSQPVCPIHIPPRTSAYGEVVKGWQCGLCGKELVEPRLLGCLHSFCTRCLQGLHQEGESEVWSDVDAGSLQLEPGGSRSTSGAGSAGSGYESEIREHSGSEGSWEEKPHKYGIFTRKVSGKSVQLLLCPTCGHETQLPLGGISALPLNYILLRKMAMADRDDGLLCDLCSTDNKAENRCNQCLVSVCGVCSEAHGRHASTSRHILLPLGGAAPRLCPMHPRSELCVYCATCQQVICRDCCIISHSGHALANATRAAAERARLLRDACERASDMPGLQQAMNELSVQEAEVDVQAAGVEAEISSWAEQYQRAVETHARALRAAAGRARHNYRTKFAERARELRARAQQASEAVVFAEEVLSEAKEDELLSLSGPVLRRLSRVCDTPLPASPRCELRFCPSAPAGGALVGRLLTSEPDWRTSILNTDGLQDLRVNCSHTATFELRDCARERIWSGGARVAGYLRRADSNAAPTLSKVTDHNDGTYSLTICPPSPGAYYFAVTLNNKPIQGSPFPCAVREAKAHSGQFHTTGGKRDSKCACNVNGQKGTTSSNSPEGHWSCCGAADRRSHCVKQSPLYHFSL